MHVPKTKQTETNLLKHFAGSGFSHRELAKSLRI